MTLTSSKLTLIGGALAVSLGPACGPSLEPSGSGGGNGGDGTTGGATSEASASGPVAGDDTTGPVASCDLVHEFGTPTTIEIVNNRAVPVVIQGTDCGDPIEMTRGGEPVLWQWDCSRPLCPTEPGEEGCWICDCGPVSLQLAPGESTSIEWDGADFSEVEPPVACDTCGSCLLSAPPAAGDYDVLVRFHEPCVDPDPLACDDELALDLASVQFHYPTDTVVLSID